MNTLLRKLTVIAVVSVCGVASSLDAMQALIANFYNVKRKSKYSINLMWINKKLKKDQKFIHPSNDEFVSTICQWAALNKDGVVNVWYDSESSTADAIKNTDKAINKECLQYSCKAPIVLKNVRNLPEVQQHPKVFSDRMPVYFRVDLLRAIAGYNDVSREETKYFVYSDLDAEPITAKQLFDKKTKEDLKQYGMVMAKLHPAHPGFENSFQIISNHKPNLLQAKKIALIDLNIKRAYNAQDKNLSAVNSLEQDVYHSYNYMFKYFYHLEGCGDMMVPSYQKGLERYDQDMHGLEPFEKVVYFYSHDKCCNGKDFRYGGFIPTKYVNVPPSEHFGSNSKKV